MSKQYYVYSTMTAGVMYAASRPVEGRDLPESIPGVLINGGTGVADKKTLVTPTGAVPTRVSGEDLERLRADRVFQEHEKNGFIIVRESEANGEAVASDMKSRDASSPITPQDYEAAGETAPTVGNETADKSDAKPRNPRKA